MGEVGIDVTIRVVLGIGLATASLDSADEKSTLETWLPTFCTAGGVVVEDLH